MPVRPHPQVIYEVTASSLTISDKHFGALVTNRGGGALTVTFPAPSDANKGAYVDIVQVVAGDLVMQTTSGKLSTFNSDAATSLTAGQANEEIGNGFTVFSDGTRWLTFQHQAAEAVTKVVA